LSYSGSIECIKTDSRRYSADLVQGDLEVTCTYTLAAADREWIQKVRKHLEEEGAQFDDVSFDKDATKLLAGVEDTVNIDDNATAATSEIPTNNVTTCLLPLMHHSATFPVSIHMQPGHCRIIVHCTWVSVARESM